MTTGRLHSIETFGAVDGPGIRTIFFLQGCPARCLYCHNPDTWKLSGGSEITPEEVLAVADRCKSYFGEDGGVTFSGGEPLMQGEFLLETIRLLKANGIKVAVDTSGTFVDKYTKEIFSECQVVLLDVKSSDPEQFDGICKCKQDSLLEAIDVANDSGTPVWVRQVVVPGINDSDENAVELGHFIKSHIKNLYEAELLGYHTLALDKYKKLGMKYRLEGVKALDKKKLNHLEEVLMKNIG